MSKIKRRISDEQINQLERVTKSIIRRLNYREWSSVWDNDDLIQAGLLAALRAYDRFDEAKGDFITYAFTRIKGAMIDEIRKLDWRPRTMIENKEDNEYRMVYLDEPVRNSEIDRYEIPCEQDFDFQLELDLLDRKITGKSKRLLKGIRRGVSCQDMCKVLKCSSAVLYRHRAKIVSAAKGES